MAARSIEYKKTNQHIFQNDFDMVGQPLKLALLTSAYHPVKAWLPATAYSVGDYAQPTTPNSHYYVCTVAGTSDAAEPVSWPTDGSTVSDNDVTWDDTGTTLPISGGGDDIFSDVSANEIVGVGYSAGGQQLNGVALNVQADETKLTADPVEWLNSTIVARWAILYQDATINGVVKPLIAAILLDDTPADVDSDNATFSYAWSNCGVYTMRVAAFTCSI